MKDNIIIWDAEIFEDEEIYLSEIGQIANINKDGTIMVNTGSGKLKINQIEYDNFVGNPKEKVSERD